MKVRKRLPESRSQKKLRLAGERELRNSERTLARHRREMLLRQQEESLQLWKVWRGAVKRRNDSDDAYAHFEATHRALWDFFRHFGMPDADATLALQRWKDGRPFEVEPLVGWAERGPRRGDLPLLALIKRQPIDEPQKERLRALVLRIVDLPYFHRNFRGYARLARRLDSPGFRAALRVRAIGGNPRAVAVEAHLEQEARMRAANQPG